MDHLTSSSSGRHSRRVAARAALTAGLVGSVLAVPWSVPAAVAAAGDVRLLLDDSVSTTPMGAGAISGDGRFVVLATEARLVPDDTGSQGDVYVVDAVAGTVRRASERTDGGQSEDRSHQGDISADGRFVAFTSEARNLVDDDDNNQSDVFVKDLVTGTLDLISRDSDGAAGDGLSWYPRISADGRYVVYSTYAPGIADGSDQGSIVVHDRSSGDTTVVSRDLDGLPATGYQATISSDGRLIAFHSDASDLVPGDTNGRIDVFVRDLVAGETSRISVGPDGEQADESSFEADISGNGRFVAFTSSAGNLVDGGVSGVDVFVHDRRDGSVERVSSRPDGRGGSGQSWEASISWGGRYVSFWSYANDLVAGDEYPTDAFLLDRATDDMTLVSRPHHQDAIDADYAGYRPAISDDGSTVSFAGDVNLIADDTDTRFDAYLYDNGDVDDFRPSVTLHEIPASPTSDPTPTFGFGSETGVSFECSLDAGGAPGFEPCVSPYTSAPLADGDHVFRIRALDEQGLRGDPVTHPFTVDTTPPAVVLDQAPPAQTSDDTPTFAFSAEAGATFQCRISIGLTPWRTCTSPITYGPLAEGTYTFTVQATDAAGNISPLVTHTFTIASEPVEVPVPSTPDLAAASDTGLSSTDNVTSDTTPTFGGTAATGTTVAIHVDGVARGSAPVTQAGTYAVTTSALPLGTRQVSAVATDADGNTSAASAALRVDIVTPTACQTATNMITGTATNNTLNGARLADRISGLGGNDTIDGRANGDCLLGGTGIDDLTGAAGNDELLGEDGNDKLALGGGTDVGMGGPGNDRVFARDGVADRIDCGTGTADVATVDALDVVVGCETVRVG